MKNKLIKISFLFMFLVGCEFNSMNNNSSSNNDLSTSTSSTNTIQGSSDNKESSSNNPGGSNNTSSSSSSKNDLPPISYVQVFAPVTYTHVYAWINTNSGVTELCNSWPGTLLKEYNSEWKTYDFQGYSQLNVIFSTGSSSNQTADLYCDKAGYYWYFDGGLHDYMPGENDGSDDNNPSYPDMPSVEATSWREFSFWDEYPSSHWKTINKYEGDRKDFRNESIYFTITTRFYDGDSSNNTQCWDGSNPSSDPAWRGDFKGLIERMDYIKALGFTSIWITPVVENCSGYDYHGYHALNFQKVDPRYLSEDVDFQTVINEAHKRDMKIVLDVVFNHTGNFGETNLFPMFEKEGDLSTFDCVKRLANAPLPSNYDNLNGGQQYDARIAAMKNTKNDGSDPNYIYHHYGNFSWESFGEQVAQIAGDCVDLNTENPLVAEYIVKSYGEFIKMGVDAFRIDTMKHISRLTLNNYIFPALYEYANKCGNENFFMFGEVCTRVREVWNRNIPALSAPFYTWKEEKEY